MRFIEWEKVAETVEKLFVDANRTLPCAVTDAISKAHDSESDPLAKSVLHKLEENLVSAKKLELPICQDTGMAVVFVKVGRNVHICGKSLEAAINEGVRRAYVNGLLRLSIVGEPLYDRKNTGDNTPATIHIEMPDDDDIADKLIITAAPKGFGSENMSALKMMTPAAKEDDIVKFVVDSVKKAGSNPCPPIFVGVGIGGNFEKCALLAKRALSRDTTSSDPRYAALEKRILDEINNTGIGPQGFGGDTTALGVMIEYAPTHIAGLPVAVNINCHVSRHKSAVI
ncbi:MAG: fumarate hydratase [Clostridiales bacterium]|nr:fumarate hydratase [Clostridiales bacterium]